MFATRFFVSKANWQIYAEKFSFFFLSPKELRRNSKKAQRNKPGWDLHNFRIEKVFHFEFKILLRIF